MKAVAYSVKSFEKEYLAKANEKKHDITLISNPLCAETVSFAEGKDAVVVFTNDDLSAPVIKKLKELGVKYIATRSVGVEHIDNDAAAAAGIKIANVPDFSSQSVAEHALALMMALNRKIVVASKNANSFDFRLEELQGFLMQGKTVGLIGFGQIAHSLAVILKGFGCTVLVHDPFVTKFPKHVRPVSLNYLYQNSHIISLHAPLTDETKGIINQKSISQMQRGVMLINTSNGSLVVMPDLLKGLESGKIGALGSDVYRNEEPLFFESQRVAREKDPILQQLIDLPNVIVTPHQGLLTTEALQEIAVRTISNLDHWQLGQCVGNACACTEHCEDALAKRVPQKVTTVDILY